MRNVLFYLFMALCAHDLERNIVFSMNDFYYVSRYTDYNDHSYSIPRNRRQGDVFDAFKNEITFVAMYIRKT